MAASPETKFTEETVLWVKHHTPKLMTLAISRPESCRFSAGQFSRLGFRDGEGFTWRAYSVVSAEYADTLEYSAVLIEGGPMFARLTAMKEGDAILLDKTATGFLLPEHFPDGKDLALSCIGSGIAPFLSILEQPEVWRRFDSISLVHSVSYADELIFSDRLAASAEHSLIEEHYCKFRFAPVTTREQAEGALSGKHVPASPESGELAAKLGMEFSTAATRFMACGNPAMVKDILQTLLDMGLATHCNRLPEQTMMENGF